MLYPLSYEGTSITLWGEVQREAANIAKLSKRDADAYVEFDRYFDRWRTR